VGRLLAQIMKLIGSDNDNPSVSEDEAVDAREPSEPNYGPVPDLATVYRNHARDVARWASSLLGPPYDADDVVQDVFVVVQRKLPSFKPRAKVSTWLFEITRRVVLAKRRRQRWLGARMRTMDETDELAVNAPGPLELLEKREASETLYELLNKLPEKYRTTLVLFEIEELSGAEVAELTGTSLENVWVRLHRGRNMFSERFKDSIVKGGGV